MNLNPFAKAKRKQAVLILTEDSRIVEDAFPVNRGYVVDSKEREAYFLDAEALIKPKTGKASVLPVSERSAVPLYLGVGNVKWGPRVKALNGQLTTIARENLEKTLAALPEKASKDKIADTFRLVILIFAILAVILILAGLLSSGNLKLPW